MFLRPSPTPAVGRYSRSRTARAGESESVHLERVQLGRDVQVAEEVEISLRTVQELADAGAQCDATKS